MLDKIASLEEPDKTNAERVRAIVAEVGPSLTPKLFYGSPAYADADGKAVLFYQERARFKGRYGNLQFFGPAQLDDGTMWPTSFAITEISSADEKAIANSCARRSAKPATNLGCAGGDERPLGSMPCASRT